jgi:hypothetical protein
MMPSWVEPGTSETGASVAAGTSVATAGASVAAGVPQALRTSEASNTTLSNRANDLTFMIFTSPFQI